MVSQVLATAGDLRRIAACPFFLFARAEDGGEANPSMSSAVSLRLPAPPLLPGFASPPSSAGTDGAVRNAQTAALPRGCACVLLWEAQLSTRPRVGHRLRRLCSAEERKARGPRAQRASCSDSLRLSERSERSSRSEFRNGATRLSTAGDRRLQGDGAASEAADGGPPAAHARTQQSSRRPAAMRRKEAPADCRLNERSGQRSFTPHQRAMNSASTCVTSIMLSIDTHSSMPWVLPDCGP